MIRRTTKEALDKRKKERENFPEFYKKHIDFIKNSNMICQECGVKLIGDVSEVAHILPKTYYKSISTEDDNIVYLCSWKSSSNCHGKFDNGEEESMKVFKFATEKIKNIITKITEKITIKTANKWLV